MTSVKEIIKLAKELPESCLAEVYDFMESAKRIAEEAEKSAPAACPRCGEKAVKNGKKDGVQQYYCKSCRRSFSERATSAISNSHASDSVWKSVICDTVRGVPLDQTARELEVAHSTVFNMRHKILNAIEQELLRSPVTLEGACEIDETYVLENDKGSEFTEFHHREPRKNGKAAKRGLSEEQICICTAATSTGKIIATAVNRASPSKEEIEQVFAGRIEDDTLLLADGNKSYSVLKDRCIVIKTDEEDRTRINHFHSFIKERNRNARGFATKNLNRYAALFAQIFGNQEAACGKIFELLKNRNNSFASIADLKCKNLLII